MNPMDREFIEKHEIKQRYLHGKLTPEEAEGFEIFLMDNPDVLDDLELDALFVSHLRRTEGSQQKTMKAWYEIFTLSPVGSFASIVFGFLIGWWIFSQPADLMQGQSGQLVYLTDMRGTNQENSQDITLSSTNKAMVLVFSPAEIEHLWYDVELKDPSGKSLHKFNDVSLSSMDELNLIVPAKLLDRSAMSLDVFVANDSNKRKLQTINMRLVVNKDE